MASGFRRVRDEVISFRSFAAGDAGLLGSFSGRVGRVDHPEGDPHEAEARREMLEPARAIRGDDDDGGLALSAEGDGGRRTSRL